MREESERRPVREDLSGEEIRDFYQWQGQAGNHQKEMYEASSPFANWWQNRRRAMVEALIAECNASSLLDVGCAEGMYVRFLSGDRSVSMGMDISQPKLMRAKAHGENPETAGFVLADASRLPFKDNSFDLVICVDVIRYLADPVEATTEIFRVSRKYVIVQSATSSGIMSPLRFVSLRWFRRRHESVRGEFSSAPFNGALWCISSRLLTKLNRYAGQNYRCSKVIGHFSALIEFLHLLLPFKGNERLLKSFVRLADKVDSYLGEKRLGKYLGVFTTVLFEKERG
jgi:ubiquinone/menaquinone biosynthesis C-methylase UbiE